MVDRDRLLHAYEQARDRLLAERTHDAGQHAGHWVGELSASALSTATAVSALAMIESRLPGAADPTGAELQRIREHIARGMRWLSTAQNADGGWGDTDKSRSNISTTMLVWAAFHLAGQAASEAPRLRRAQQFIHEHGGIAGLRRRYGIDKTFAVPILTNCALAGVVNWTEVSPLPFELACVPQSWYRFMRMPVVSYAIPALVAIGQARYHQRKPLNPITRLVRRWAVAPSLEVLQRIQPASGGFLEATPLTSFVVMSLASFGQTQHPVARLGLDFLLKSARPDGSWPVDTNLATWLTTLSVNGLATAEEDVSSLADVDWLLACQNRQRHPFTGADPGGWGWSDLTGAVPDADDTAGALLALATLHAKSTSSERLASSEQLESEQVETDRASRLREAAATGCDWLFSLQNRDGGWPTFCRGWGKLPFDRSGTDLTAHALRALNAWRTEFGSQQGAKSEQWLARFRSAAARGWAYLEREQRPDGSWVPLWFGNEDRPEDENPVYGTARVLLVYRDLGQLAARPARRGLAWLAAQQNPGGGWGGGPWSVRHQGLTERSSVEETALAVEALLASATDLSLQVPVAKGINWLIENVESNGLESAPIGFYFAKLWYYERLYPLIFTVSALGHAVKATLPTARVEAGCATP
jgi:squalene-hopene/tetraprenyl-beta-curcumene cyclase